MEVGRSVRVQQTFLWALVALAVSASISGCVSTGGRNMETVVTDMHQRVTLLDEGLEPSLAKLNATAAALIQRVDENERQVKILTSLVEENQHKLDKLLKMLSDLRATLYRHWGLTLPATRTSAGSGSSGIQIVPPERSQPAPADREIDDASAPPVIAPSVESRGDTQAYVAAKDLYDQEDYGAAEAAFTEFLRNFPQSEEGHKAQFWLGKCLLNQSEYSRAIRAFEGLRRDYPDSSYMAFALHNQAVGHFRLGERNEAIGLMEAVVANYPTSTAAEHAARDLKQLRGQP